MNRLDEQQQRRNGDINAIMSGFVSDNPLFRFQAICGAVNNNRFNDAIQHQLIRLAEDDDVIIGYSISQLAVAALDRFGAVKYKGTDDTVRKLLQAEKWFDR